MTENDVPLGDKVAVVTGAARNIGRATAKRLADYGVAVVVNAVQDREAADAVAHEIVDVFGGHPAQSDYHYHFVPERLDEVPPLSDGHSGLIGYIRDGFGLYGYNGIGAKELSNEDLDECHGHSSTPLGYHYHATIEYPYTIGCYRGTPT